MSSSITPEQARFLLNSVVPPFTQEHVVTKRVIEAIPLDKGDYRPDSVSKSALELAWHIVAAEKRFFAGISAGALDFTPLNRPDSIRNAADIAAWSDTTFAENVQKLEARTGEQLA